MQKLIALRLALLAAFLLHPSSFLLAQGPLTPPPGAPAPTMKTLDQLDAKLEKRTPISALPFTIVTPGAYYLTGNLTGVAGQHGIIIAADHVTLDLNGFELVGPGSGVTVGIRVSAGRFDATIRNGVVRGWLSSGVVAENVDATLNVIVKNLARLNTTNYDIVADNRYGAIVNISGTPTAAAVGNSFVSTLLSTDPWANFAH